ncbi:MAG: hypothetical protein LBU33_03190 [Endomicrobium sp.]|jgi:uncharacterized protein (UPF0333 family)|nr:hypothetical protein [Endomicrobium sp.]
MKINKGQTSTEFLLVFVVLLMATSSIFAVYRKFWKGKYERVSTTSGMLATAAKMSGSQMSYVK